MKNLDWYNIDSVWVEYEKWYVNNDLKNKGVKFFTKPNTQNKKISQLTFAFLYLWINLGDVVSKEQITKAYRNLFPDYYSDFQAGRHIGNRLGYNIQNYHHNIKGYKLVDLTFTVNTKNQSKLSDSDWVKLKESYGNKCACCGSLEGEPMFRANGITKLERGHMNPDLELTYDNTIPQCQYCNGASKSKRVFNKKGETIAIKNKLTQEWVYC